MDTQTHLVSRPQNKTNSSSRNVPIFIGELYEALKTEKKDHGKVVNYSPSKIYEGINRVCRKNGFPEVGIHGLRHSFASLAYHVGIPALTTMQIGGWSDKYTMIQTYTHIATSDLNSSSEKLRKFFEKAGAE